MPERMSADVVTPAKSSPRGYLDYAARPDTSLAKGVAILRQLPSRATALSVTTAVFDWRMIRPETHACGADEWRARWLDPANAYDRRIQDSEFSGKKDVGGISTKMNIGNHLSFYWISTSQDVVLQCMGSYY